MTELSYMWGGTSTGDATSAPYTDDALSDMMDFFINPDRTLYGVLSNTRTGYSGGLAVTNPSSTTVRLASGAAIVDGKLYTNSANLDFTPGGNGTYCLVLRKDFAAQTVRAVLKSGSSVTQTEGTIWEIKLADITVGGGASAITDRRKFIVAPISTAPKTLYVAPFEGYDVTTGLPISTYGNPGIETLDGNESYIKGMFRVPDDFASGMTISVLVEEGLGGTGNDIVAMAGVTYGSIGEDFGVHKDVTGTQPGGSVTTVTITSVIQEVYALSMASPSIGDIVHATFFRDGDAAADTAGKVRVYGWLVTYTPVASRALL